MIGDVLLDCELEPGERRTLAGFENHAGRTLLDPMRNRSAASSPASATMARADCEGCRVGRAVGTYLHGPLLPRNPWFADWVIRQALAPLALGETTPPQLERAPPTSSSRRLTQCRARARRNSRGGRGA